MTAGTGSAVDIARRKQSAARRLRFCVAASFPLAFLIHDGEEVLAARSWQRRAPALLRAKFPWLPQPVVDVIAVNPRRMRKAVGIVAGAVAAVSGLSVFRLDRPANALRCVIAVFGAHAATHVAQACALRAYTPGVATAGLLVGPYALWAWLALNRADGHNGLTLRQALGRGAPAVLALVVFAHLVAAITEGRAMVTARRDAPNPRPTSNA